ncbi:MAG: SDR family oxidoreductase [Actinomycetota bacterium]|nr:SDR family oxidoreductase [Actinomycetota bacterium]
MSAVIVTGAGGAIGQAIARRFSKEGRCVVCVDRDERVLDLCDELDDAVPCVVDLTEDDAPERVLLAAEEGGGAAVLVNNAGITRDGRALKLDLDDFRLVIRVNLVAPLRLAEAVAPRLSDGGSIVNIASRAALGNFGQANYVAAKSALVGASRALAVQWAPRLRVNAVAPGLVNTPMTEAMPPDVYAKLVARVPAERAADPAEVADAVAYLASDRASYITGQMLLACGGRSVAG